MGGVILLQRHWPVHALMELYVSSISTLIATDAMSHSIHTDVKFCVQRDHLAGVGIMTNCDLYEGFIMMTMLVNRDGCAPGKDLDLGPGKGRSVSTQDRYGILELPVTISTTRRALSEAIFRDARSQTFSYGCGSRLWHKSLGISSLRGQPSGRD